MIMSGTAIIGKISLFFYLSVFSVYFHIKNNRRRVDCVKNEREGAKHGGI